MYLFLRIGSGLGVLLIGGSIGFMLNRLIYMSGNVVWNFIFKIYIILLLNKIFIYFILLCVLNFLFEKWEKLFFFGFVIFFFLVLFCVIFILFIDFIFIVFRFRLFKDLDLGLM